MTEVAFTRLFAMPAFEGLRVYRRYESDYPSSPVEDILARIRRAEADFRSFDLDAALSLHALVPANAPAEGVLFYRECIASLLVTALPEWAKLVTLGRARFIKRLEDSQEAELRDVGSLFRQARLLDDPPTWFDVKWWDDIQAHVRSHKSSEAMDRARRAEQLTLERETANLQKAGIEKPPVWASIEDNTLGYDVLSYEMGEYGLLNRLIEVKSTVASPLRFYLSANEWKQALKYGEAYVFHVWDLQPAKPVLHILTVAQVAPHVPQNFEKGKWETALIPVSV